MWMLLLTTSGQPTFPRVPDPRLTTSACGPELELVDSATMQVERVPAPAAERARGVNEVNHSGRKESVDNSRRTITSTYFRSPACGPLDGERLISTVTFPLPVPTV